MTDAEKIAAVLNRIDLMREHEADCEDMDCYRVLIDEIEVVLTIGEHAIG